MPKSNTKARAVATQTNAATVRRSNGPRRRCGTCCGIAGLSAGGNRHLPSLPSGMFHVHQGHVLKGPMPPSFKLTAPMRPATGFCRRARRKYLRFGKFCQPLARNCPCQLLTIRGDCPISGQLVRAFWASDSSRLFRFKIAWAERRPQIRQDFRSKRAMLVQSCRSKDYDPVILRHSGILVAFLAAFVRNESNRMKRNDNESRDTECRLHVAFSLRRK